jgi:hypothetical protein
MIRQNQLITTNAIAKRGCASQEVLAAQLVLTTLVGMNEIEAFTQKKVNTPFSKRKIEIPVSVNYCTEPQLRTFQTQIQSQIDVLNDDFNATNSDFNSSIFISGVATIWNLFLFWKLIEKLQLRRLGELEML